MHEFNLSANALRAMQLFVSKRAGSTDTNPNSALHLRYLNDTSIRITCTNGQAIAIARLITKSEQLESFYWPDEEKENAVSFRLDAQAIAAISKMGQRLILTVGAAICHIRPAGDGAGTSIEVQRVRGRQISLPIFDDLENIKPVKAEELAERGQFTVNPLVMHTAYKSAKLLGYGIPESLHIAIIGHTYGVSFGSADLWLLIPMSTVTPPIDGGLPPYWVTGGNAAEHTIYDAIDEAFEVIQEEEDTAEEQAQMEFPDEHTPSNLDIEAELHEQETEEKNSLTEETE